MRHAGRQPAENVSHGDAHAANARPPAALAGLLGEDAFTGGVHDDFVPYRVRPRQRTSGRMGSAGGAGREASKVGTIREQAVASGKDCDIMSTD